MQLALAGRRQNERLGPARSCVFTKITKGKSYETDYIIDRNHCFKLHHVGARPGRGNSIRYTGGETIHYHRRNSNACARGEDHCNAHRATSRSEKRKARSACARETYLDRPSGGQETERARRPEG